MRNRNCIVIFALLLCSQFGWSDSITLKSGDHLTGTLMQISSGIVSFRTKLAGRIMVPHEEIVSLNTSSFMVVAMRDESVLPGRIQTIDNEILLLSPDGKQRTLLNLARIKEIESLPADSVPVEEPPALLTAHIKTGYQLRSGTKDASGPTLDLGVSHDGTHAKTTFDAAFEYTEDADDADRFMAGELSVVSNTDATLRPTLVVEASRDRNRALDYRFEASVGATSTLASDNLFTLEGFAGVGGSVDRFDPDPLRGDLGSRNNIPASASTKNRENLNLDLRIRYTREFLQNSTITEQLTFKPSLTRPGDVRTEIESSITVPIAYNLKLKLNFDLLFDYDSETRYDDISRWNTAVSAGIRVDF